jgi:hypothetical protein
LVVACGVDGEFADDFSGGGVEDGDVEVADEHQNVGSGVGAADADVVPLLEPVRLPIDAINLFTGANLNNPVATACDRRSPAW